MTDQQDKIRQVRDRTGHAYVECQRALAEAGGEVDRAVDLMRLRGEIYTVDAREAVLGRLKKERGTAAEE